MSEDELAEAQPVVKAPNEKAPDAIRKVAAKLREAMYKWRFFPTEWRLQTYRIVGFVETTNMMYPAVIKGAQTKKKIPRLFVRYER